MIRSFRNLATASSACLVVLMTQSAFAHFIWLVPQATDGGTTVQVYFAEDAAPDNPDMLKRLTGMKAWQLDSGRKATPLKLQQSDDSLAATVPANESKDSLFIATYDFGVMSRGDDTFRLKYYAKTGPDAANRAWTEIDCSEYLPLDVVPTVADGQVRVLVRFHGKPVAGAELKASGPGLDQFEGTTDADGLVEFSTAEPGLYSIRARHIEQQSGEVDGKSYDEVRHYGTVALNAAPAGTPVAKGHLQPLTQAVTSFGGAILDNNLYIYGGHTGGAHSYSKEEQGHVLRRLDLKTGEWDVVADGPPLQGLALVAHGGKLYRVGGFAAKNAEGEDHDLWSQNGVAAFDPKTKQWSDMPSLPEPRSSFDAAVLGDVIYVVGGWMMAGGADHAWHDTAWALDLSAKSPAWASLPNPPFQRRALAVAAHNGKLYAIGGMQEEGGPTPRVDVFDPATGQWSVGPELIGEGRMTGFGASAFATGNRLYVSTIDGNLQRLTEDGSAWEIVSDTPTARFFHRMLPVDDQHLLVVGGANMGVGKFEEIEVIPVASDQKSQK